MSRKVYWSQGTFVVNMQFDCDDNDFKKTFLCGKNIKEAEKAIENALKKLVVGNRKVKTVSAYMDYHD